MRPFLFALVALAAACASAPSGTGAIPTPATSPTPTATPPGAPLANHLAGGTGPWPGAIAGLRFHTPTRAGTTDAQGAFEYLAGETVTFSVADVDFRPAPGAPMLSPFQLAGDGSCERSDELVRALVLLQSLDQDADPSNGLALPAAGPGPSQRPISTLGDADVAALVASLFPGRAPVAPGAALDAFVTQIDGELWEQAGMDSFPGGFTRSQGVTTDGSSWFFSWKLGLERTDLGYATQLGNTLAIPTAQALLGDDHIGDIDWWNGVLYVPLEDGGSDYQHPFLATYDPETLTSTFAAPVSTTLMTSGVPWVAADGPRGSLYIAEWDPTTEIHVFDLATLAYTGSIPLTTTVHRIQGAKVFEGSLYLSTDDGAKDVLKVSLDTGTVIPLFAIGGSSEEEGIAFLARPDGSLMHTLVADGLGMDFRHHRRTREPLRKSVCAP